jgi:hypothetical protein
METARSELPDDVERLKALVVEKARRAYELEAISTQLKEENAALQLKLLEVTDKYETLRQKFFGASSEKRKHEEDNPKQGLLFNCLMSTEFPLKYHTHFPIVIKVNFLVSSSACRAGCFVMRSLPQADSSAWV